MASGQDKRSNVNVVIRLPDELLHLDLPGHQPVLELGDGAHAPHHLPVLAARHTAAETLRSKISLFMQNKSESQYV